MTLRDSEGTPHLDWRVAVSISVATAVLGLVLGFGIDRGNIAARVANLEKTVDELKANDQRIESKILGRELFAMYMAKNDERMDKNEQQMREFAAQMREFAAQHNIMIREIREHRRESGPKHITDER